MKRILAAVAGLAVVLSCLALQPASAQTPPPKGPNPMLLTPDKMTEKAPDVFRAKFVTSKGAFVIEVTRAWAPQGADRFYNLVKDGFYDDVRFFRVVPNFMVQFGINGDPKVNTAMQTANIPDDPPTQSNTRGMVTYAMAGPNTRTSQIFISFKDNSFLDKQGFSPFGKVIEGMAVVDSIYSGDDEKPDQGQIQSAGNDYLMKNFPKLDYVKTAKIVTAAAAVKKGEHKGAAKAGDQPAETPKSQGQ